MENAERLVNKAAEIHEFASEIARMITGAQMPEFSSENMSVADASKLIGISDLEDQAQQEARQQYAERQEKRFGRLAEFSLDPENQQRYEQKQKEWKHVRMRTGDMDTQEYVEVKKAKAFLGEPIDITSLWMDKDSGHGKVKDILKVHINNEFFEVNGKTVLLDYSAHEKEIAEIIAEKCGKNVEMVPRVTYPQGIQTPDYLIDGSKYDLKTPIGNGKNTLYGMMKSKKRQANNFVICADKTELSTEELKRQIKAIYTSRNTGLSVLFLCPE